MKTNSGNLPTKMTDKKTIIVAPTAADTQQIQQIIYKAEYTQNSQDINTMSNVLDWISDFETHNIDKQAKKNKQNQPRVQNEPVETLRIQNKAEQNCGSELMIATVNTEKLSQKPHDPEIRKHTKKKTATQNHPERDLQQIQTRNHAKKKMNYTSNDSLLADNDTLIEPQIIRQQEQTQIIK